MHMLRPAALLLLLGFAAPLAAQTPERFWTKPGPAQGSPNAPKLLIMYPLDATRLAFSAEGTRFAGRVEPTSASVTLNGDLLTVLPGGVFTGLLNPPVGETAYTFKAVTSAGETSVIRRVIRAAEAKGPAPWPLEFGFIDIENAPGTNDYWLRPGSTLPVKVRGSAGAAMSVRVGPTGPWLPMKPGSISPKFGALYEIEIPAEAAPTGSQSAPLEFMLEGSQAPGSPPQRITQKSLVTLRQLPADLASTATINKNLGTFLVERTGWKRYGNWVRDTPFSVIERLGDRVKTGFGTDVTGFIEIENVNFAPQPAPLPMPALSPPALAFQEKPAARRMTADFASPLPLACVFESPQPNLLIAKLLGAASLTNATTNRAGHLFDSIGSLDRTPLAPPMIGIRFDPAQTLWGYGWSKPNPATLRLTTRLKPAPAKPSRPLTGIKIMIDAGHGGDDTGALGPSGIAESDLNLTTSKELEKLLKGMGAVTRMTRVADVTVPLDDRVDMALAFDPDLFVSVHHNSVPLSTDPLSDAGSKVYYHYPHAKPLADSIARELTAYWTPADAPRVLTENFRVNRNVSQCPSVLVEVAFVCNPVDEIRLRQKGTAREVAACIARGIENLMRAN